MPASVTVAAASVAAAFVSSTRSWSLGRAARGESSVQTEVRVRSIGFDAHLREARSQRGKSARDVPRCSNFFEVRCAQVASTAAAANAPGDRPPGPAE
jgi:hypothetical protein